MSRSFSDDSSSPKYDTGDYVGGIKKLGKEIQKLAGHICIVGLPDKTVHVKKLLIGKNSTFTLLPINQEALTDTEIHYRIKIEYAAKITWHRKIENN